MSYTVRFVSKLGLREEIHLKNIHRTKRSNNANLKKDISYTTNYKHLILLGKNNKRRLSKEK